MCAESLAWGPLHTHHAVTTDARSKTEESLGRQRIATKRAAEVLIHDDSNHSNRALIGTWANKAYLFNTGTGFLLDTLEDPSLTGDDAFGQDVAIDGNHVLIGDFNDDTGGNDVGRAFLFTAVPEPADLNMDGFVDGLDLGILLASWGTTTTPDMGELDGTPPVDGLDLGALLGAWNPPPLPAAASVPEPSTLMLAGLAAIGLFARRGRCSVQTTSF